MKTPLDLSGTPNMRPLLTEAKRLGCSVAPVDRKGELRITHPSMPDRLNVNARRKSGTRVLVSMLRRLQTMEAQDG